MLRASPLRGIAPSRYGVGSSACPALFLRPHAHHRPHVSISWALPQTLASCGILPNTPCGWHLLTTTRESTCRVTPFPVPMVASVGRCSPPGFCGSANRSVSKAAGALSCAVLAPACQPLALVGLHGGSPHLCLRCPEMLARRDTRREAARGRRLSPLQTVEDQSQAWGICCHSCTWREGFTPSWRTELHSF